MKRKLLPIVACVVFSVSALYLGANTLIHFMHLRWDLLVFAGVMDKQPERFHGLTVLRREPLEFLEGILSRHDTVRIGAALTLLSALALAASGVQLVRTRRTATKTEQPSPRDSSKAADGLTGTRDS